MLDARKSIVRLNLTILVVHLVFARQESLLPNEDPLQPPLLVFHVDRKCQVAILLLMLSQLPQIPHRIASLPWK